MADDVNLTQVALKLEGYTGSDIKEVCREAVVRISHEEALRLEQSVQGAINGQKKQRKAAVKKKQYAHKVSDDGDDGGFTDDEDEDEFDEEEDEEDDELFDREAVEYEGGPTATRGDAAAASLLRPVSE